MTDNIEKIGLGTVIQHGKLSNRVYLMKLNQDDFPVILEKIRILAEDNSYSKIFCKAPAWAVPVFISKGYVIEAHIPDFYDNQVDVFFLSKFLSINRLQNFEYLKMKELTQLFLSTDSAKKSKEVPTIFNFCALNAEDVDEITFLYKKVFESYPFPIFNPDYILSTMNENVQYYGIRFNGELIALSSAEIDKKGKNVEMTDFATLPAFRGNKLASLLLGNMELEMKKQDIKTLYTIARLNSMAMNKNVFESKL